MKGLRMQTNINLLRAASVCAFIFALAMTFAVLSRLHTPDPRTLDEAVALSSNVVFNLRTWSQFLSFFFIMIAFWGVAVKKLETSFGLVIIGFVFCAVFVLLELFTRSIDLFVAGGSLATTYASETNDLAKTALRINFDLVNSGIFALYFPLLTAHMLGSCFFGLATWKGVGLEKFVSVLFLINALRLSLRLMQMYGSQSWLAGVNRWTYVVLIFLFSSLGVWLWDKKKGCSYLNA